MPDPSECASRNGLVIATFIDMSALQPEWLVTDPRGAFAMGTHDGIRTRKYHGFYQGCAGRSETSFLADLDFQCNDIFLWPHRYLGPEGPLVHPDLTIAEIPFRFELTDSGPQWQWLLSSGELKFHVFSCFPGGIGLNWAWSSKTKASSKLRVRGLWALRNLHSLGGRPWTWKYLSEPRSAVEGSIGKITGEKQVLCQLVGRWKWIDDPCWYRSFFYLEELQRGYDYVEDLYSAGVLEIDLAAGESSSWVISEDLNDLSPLLPGESVEIKPQKRKAKIFDFVLTRPAGLVAGYPWFGEWGRDTFVSLPGLVAAGLRTHSASSVQSVQSEWPSESLEEFWIWVRELLNRWGIWIERRGMLPNILSERGLTQWDSADATLWWCHALASLWAYSLCLPNQAFPDFRQEYLGWLNQAIDAIRTGRHAFLRIDEEGLLEVTGPHATWMDAKIDGVPVTPRTGRLPEINALWFQACCLQQLWSGKREQNLPFLERLAAHALECEERDRPNLIFLHSIPLAPSFVLRDSRRLEEDLFKIAETLWTPVGLRTLSPLHPAFRPHCIGSQKQRDQSYHQGPPWAWLAGHFEMARHRYAGQPVGDKMFSPEILARMPIEGHIPELFDAEPPFTPRGTPAQMWSLACLEEAKVRLVLNMDQHLQKLIQKLILTQRSLS